MKLVFATHNKHKLEELGQMLHRFRSSFSGSKQGITLVSLTDIGLHDDIPETADTLKDNALLKARYVYEKLGISCFADDSGLEVEALNGAPGVYSARYAGPQKNDADNISLLLENLEGKASRKACFKTVLALNLEGKEHLFEGRVDGVIIHEKRGNKGFGYDPVFLPDGHDRTFAEMNAEEKNAISHRRRAVEKMVAFMADLKI